MADTAGRRVGRWARFALVLIGATVAYFAGCLAVLAGWAAGLNSSGGVQWRYLPLIPLGYAAIVAAPLVSARLRGKRPSVGSAIAIFAGLLFAVQIAYGVAVFGGGAIDVAVRALF